MNLQTVDHLLTRRHPNMMRCSLWVANKAQILRDKPVGGVQTPSARPSLRQIRVYNHWKRSYVLVIDASCAMAVGHDKVLLTWSASRSAYSVLLRFQSCLGQLEY